MICQINHSRLVGRCPVIQNHFIVMRQFISQRYIQISRKSPFRIRTQITKANHCRILHHIGRIRIKNPGMKSLDATMNGMPFIVFIQIIDPVIQNKFRIPYSICITPYRSTKLGLSAQIISQAVKS